MTTKEYPILYSTPMIQAILNGTKNQTRRIMNPQPRLALLGNGQPIGNGQLAWEAPKRMLAIPFTKGCMNQIIDLCPYGQVGEFTWAREKFQSLYDFVDEKDVYLYFADNDNTIQQIFGISKKHLKWKPSIFMPRSASRIVRENIDIRVERVADISEEDAIGEGIELINNTGWKDYQFVPKHQFQSNTFMSPVLSYKSLWNSINNKPKLNKKLDSYIVYPFDEQSAAKWGNTYRNKPLIVAPNPWVWVVKFK